MTELADAEIRALNEALDDEYHAWATYDQVIAYFGEVAPFRHIREAEARHIAASAIGNILIFFSVSVFILTVFTTAKSSSDKSCLSL